MIYILMGKSAVGKDTILQKILSNKSLNLKQIISYTTRPIKEGEENGREYFFVDENQMNDLSKEGKIIECRVYDTIYGKWYYFTTDENIDIDNFNYIIIGTLPTFLDLKKRYGSNIVKGIYLYIDDGIRLQRALDRERKSNKPRFNEMCRRFLTDNEDFSNEKLSYANVNLYIQNDDLSKTVANITSFIQKGGYFN